MEDLISIIIPIYNAKENLERCLKSIQNQTYKKIEVLLIDDGSTDESRTICQEYSKIDNRFKYYYKKNEGVAITRNFGIKKSTGNYITFVDSDDYISTKYIEILYKILKENNCDISICKSQNIYNDNFLLKNNKEGNKTKIYSNIEAIEDMFLGNNIDTSFWAKMYKTSVFFNIEIRNYKIFEDLDTMYKIFLNSKRIIFSYEKLYYYYIRKNSLTHNNFSEKNLLVLKILEDIEMNVTKVYPNLYDAVLCRKIDANFYILRNSSKDSIVYKNCKKFIINNRKKVLKIKNCSLKTKFGIFVSFISFELIKPIFHLRAYIRILVDF